MNTLPDDADARCEYPMADGLLYYFPSALAEVARVSKIGNDQHNPGEPMHWARGKSTDHANKIMRHLLDAGEFDKDGTRHTAKLAWRALALLQEELEAAGAPMARNARTNSVRELFAAIDAMRASQDIRDAGEFTQPPNCSPGVSESRVHESAKTNELGHVEKVDSAHPMAAEALRVADEKPRRSESAWSVAWPDEAPSESAASITEYQTLVGN